MFIDQKIEKKIDDLLAQMTLEEKIGQICQVRPSPVGGFEISEEEAAQLLKDGSISQYAKPKDIIEHPQNSFVKEFILNQLEIKRNNIFTLFGETYA